MVRMVARPLNRIPDVYRHEDERAAACVDMCVDMRFAMALFRANGFESRDLDKGDRNV